MAWPLGATVNIASGVLMATLGAVLLVANPRKDWNRLFALFATFWGAQILAVNAPRVLASPEAARFAGELSLAFLLPLYFFLAMFAAVFPRPRAPLGTSALAVAALLVPAALALGLLFFDSTSLLWGVDALPDGHFTMTWGPAFPLVAVAPLYAAFFYALFVMMRRLDEAGSPIERKQIAFVLGALALFVAYSVPSNLVAFGSAALGLAPVSEADQNAAILYAAVMLAGLALLVILAARLARSRQRDARAILGAIALVPVVAVADITLSGEQTLLGVVRIASVALIAYAVTRYQLFDIDLKVKAVAATGAAALGGLALAGAAWIVVRRVDAPLAWGGALAAGAALVAFWPLLRVANRVADRLAPRVSREGDHVYLRKLEVYRASVESALREGRDASAAEPWLAQQRARLGLTERDHGVVVSLASAGANPVAASPDMAPGSVVFGKYEIERVLAEGGYGRVFLARDRILHRNVVVKELLARWRGDPRVVQTFLREARIAGDLNHPHIVAIYAVEAHGQDHYIVMEHMPGGTLEEKLASGKVPVPEAVRIARAVLSALEAAHAKGVVHRDVKPSNVLLGAKGEVKLADFGIAQVMSDEPQRTISGLTTASFHPGTLQYMSPEQARGKPLDARSDVYAVGALLYRMVAGRAHLDVAGLDEFTARNAIASAPQPAPLEGAPTWLDAAVRRSLAPEPDARFPSAEAFGRALEAPLNPPVEAA